VSVSRAGNGPLVSRALEGDEEAWRELYARHGRRLQVWLASLPSGDPAASPEDVASEAWLTAASKLGEFTGSDDDFAGWLFTIARLTLNNRRRTAQRRRTDAREQGDPDVGWGVAESPEGEVVGQAETRRLLAMLSPREAEVIACLEVVGLDVAGTAAALEMSPTAVRVARHRALRRLRQILTDERDQQV
jgi:RNA polymerase sigma-70 factor (ECF subfamily)